ncbi:ATP-binding cassette domain-containing protein [Alkalibacterium iburiense]|uniref:ATP-binding cassette domain-containing protein n=1 Tax=Alkalibacterium iburiense TaxID=290589 RepID=A0ABN0XDM1_9LACT
MMNIENVTKQYGEHVVVNNVTLPIEKGKMTTCIGPNGAGKSTLLEMVSRLIPQDTGHIYIDGGEVKSWKKGDLAKRLSVLKQTNHMNIRLTVRELVSFGRFPYTKGRLNDHCHSVINESLSYLGLSDIQNRYIDTLSGGQLQRTLIAMVLCQDTDYILLDEPLNNLDMNFGVQMMKTLRRLVDELGKAVITIVHDINFAAAYSDNIIAMKDGKIFATGTVDEVVSKEVLDELYEMDVQIMENDGIKYCLYYRN